MIAVISCLMPPVASAQKLCTTAPAGNYLPAQLITNNDTAVCRKFAVAIRTNSRAYDSCWVYDSSMLIEDYSWLTVVPKQPTTYRFFAKVLGPEMVTNGSFSEGNTGFTSAYQYTTGMISEGQYAITSRPNDQHPVFMNCDADTAMVVNGHLAPLSAVWINNYSVLLGRSYLFSFAARSVVYSQPMQLNVEINGSVVGSVVLNHACMLEKLQVEWTANLSRARIRIYCTSTLSGGNDFSLDNISFKQIHLLSDSITVTTVPCCGCN